MHGKTRIKSFSIDLYGQSSLDFDQRVNKMLELHKLDAEDIKHVTEVIDRVGRRVFTFFCLTDK